MTNRKETFSLYQISPNFEAKQTLLGDFYLYNKRNGDVYDINETSYFILKHINEKTFEDILELIMNEFEIIDEKELRQDLNEILETYLDLGILLYKEMRDL